MPEHASDHAATEPGLSRPLYARKLGNFVLAFLLCLLLVEMLSRFLVNMGEAPSSHSREFDTKYSLALTKPDKSEKKHAQIILLGNSYMMRGIYPELLKARLQAAGKKVSVRNLAASGSTPAMNQFLLESAMHKGNKPRLVIYAISPVILNRHYLANDTGNPEQAFTHSYMGRCHGAKKKKLSCRAGALYMVRYQDFLRNELRNAPSRIFENSAAMKIRPERFPLTEVSPDGWSPGYPVYAPEEFNRRFAIAHASKTQRDITERLLGNFEWDPQPLQELQNYCQKNKLRLVYLWLPEGPIWRDYYKRYKISETDFAAHVSQMVASDLNGNTEFINLHDLPLNTYSFYNPDHLNTIGGVRSTEALAESLLAPVYRPQLQAAP